MTIEIPVPNMAISEVLDILLVMSLFLFAAFNLRSRREPVAATAGCDLRELEGVLSGLVQEASEQSAVLDQSLRMRRDELQSLLLSLDEKKTDPGHSGQNTARHLPLGRYGQAVAQSHREVTIDDVPNESWLKPIQVPNSTVLQRSVAKNTYEQNLLKGAESVADYTIARSEDRLSGPGISAEQLKSRPQPTVSAASAAPGVRSVRAGHKGQLTARAARTVSKPLLDQVEQTAFDDYSNRTYDMVADATTTRIAKRLLSRGEPIHAVARKLELTTTQVRELYRLMRLSGEIVDPESRHSEQNAVHIVRGRRIEEESVDSEFEELDYLPEVRRAS